MEGSIACVKQYSSGPQRIEDTDREDNALLEWLGKHADDCAVLYNIGRKGQVQSLIVTIPTWKN
jgi:hypothetical protein